jgi:cbb3-type cytochrome oxidase subunit 3
MRQNTTTTGRYDHSIAETLWSWRAEALWTLAGLVLLLAFGDALILLALAFVTVTVAWWIYRTIEHRAESGESVEINDAEWASVTDLRPALTNQRALKKTSPHVPWHGPSAA